MLVTSDECIPADGRNEDVCGVGHVFHRGHHSGFPAIPSCNQTILIDRGDWLIADVPGGIDPRDHLEELISHCGSESKSVSKSTKDETGGRNPDVCHPRHFGFEWLLSAISGVSPAAMDYDGRGDHQKLTETWTPRGHCDSSL
jgi:hypothetical protein